MKDKFTRIAGLATAFQVGRVVGKRLDEEGRAGLRWKGGLDSDLGLALGKEGKMAAAAGAATVGWAVLTRRERLVAFAAGAALGYDAFGKAKHAVEERWNERQARASVNIAP